MAKKLLLERSISTSDHPGGTFAGKLCSCSHTQNGTSGALIRMVSRGC